MNPQARRFGWFVWGGVILTLTILLLGFYLASLKLRTAVGKNLPVLGTVQDFKLTDQRGKTVTLEDLRGHVWIADIIFTRCAGPCPEMTRQMRMLQEKLSSLRSVQFVSLTTDPEFDTPAVLARYAERFDADQQSWRFLTGTKAEIGRLAIDSLKLTAIEKKPEDRDNPEDLFIHSTIFVIVDKKARLRGVFETTGEDVNVARVHQDILAAARRLEHEK